MRAPARAYARPMWRCALIAMLAAGCAREPSAPRVTRWAWERPEDLRQLPGDVAFLAATVRVGERVDVRPRQQPLAVAPEARLTAVVRIEVAAGARLDAAVRKRIVATARRAAARTAALQIDYDARRSERPFYRALLGDLAAALPQHRLSITALASWCLYDPWIDELDMIEEAVPMLFEMGADSRRVRAALASGADFVSPRCRRSVGVSLAEPLPDGVLAERRRWLWSARPW